MGWYRIIIVCYESFTAQRVPKESERSFQEADASPDGLASTGLCFPVTVTLARFGEKWKQRLPNQGARGTGTAPSLTWYSKPLGKHFRLSEGTRAQGRKHGIFSDTMGSKGATSKCSSTRWLEFILAGHNSLPDRIPMSDCAHQPEQPGPIASSPL